MRLLIAFLLLSLGVARAEGPTVTVGPNFETDAVFGEGDAADDTTVWIHPADSRRSLIVGTDKKFGLHFFDLHGKRVRSYPVGRINNVDSRPDFDYSRQRVHLMAGTDRSANRIQFWTISPAQMELVSLGALALSYEPYGICLGRIQGQEAVSVFITTKTGLIERWDLRGTSRMETKYIGRFQMTGIVEGCAVDDQTGQLFVSEEEVGLWHFDLIRGGAPKLIDRVAPHGRLVADVEGVAIYHAAGKPGFVVVSSQGDNSFLVYNLLDGAFRGRFTITASGHVDGVSETDGVDIVSFAVNEQFPDGFFIAQDGSNELPSTGSATNVTPSVAKQNFKVVDWRVISRSLNL